MYVEPVPNRNSLPAILLRQGWREGSKTRKRTLANLSDWPPHKIETLRRLLRDETLVSPQDLFRTQQTLPHGHVEAILSTIRPRWWNATGAWWPTWSRDQSSARQSWPPPGPARDNVYSQSWHRDPVCGWYSRWLRRGRGVGFAGYETDPGARPEFRRAAGGARFRFYGVASRRGWPGCACGFYCLRASLGGGGWRAGSCDWGRFRRTWEQLCIINRRCQENMLFTWEQLASRTFS